MGVLNSIPAVMPTKHFDQPHTHKNVEVVSADTLLQYNQPEMAANDAAYCKDYSPITWYTNIILKNVPFFCFTWTTVELYYSSARNFMELIPFSSLFYRFFFHRVWLLDRTLSSHFRISKPLARNHFTKPKMEISILSLLPRVAWNPVAIVWGEWFAKAIEIQRIKRRRKTNAVIGVCALIFIIVANNLS